MKCVHPRYHPWSGTTRVEQATAAPTRQWQCDSRRASGIPQPVVRRSSLGCSHQSTVSHHRLVDHNGTFWHERSDYPAISASVFSPVGNGQRSQLTPGTGEEDSQRSCIGSPPGSARCGGIANDWTMRPSKGRLEPQYVPSGGREPELANRCEALHLPFAEILAGRLGVYSAYSTPNTDG